MHIHHGFRRKSCASKATPWPGAVHQRWPRTLIGKFSRTQRVTHSASRSPQKRQKAVQFAEIWPTLLYEVKIRPGSLLRSSHALERSQGHRQPPTPPSWRRSTANRAPARLRGGRTTRWHQFPRRVGGLLHRAAHRGDGGRSAQLSSDHRRSGRGHPAERSAPLKVFQDLSVSFAPWISISRGKSRPVNPGGPRRASASSNQPRLLASGRPCKTCAHRGAAKRKASSRKMPSGSASTQGNNASRFRFPSSPKFPPRFRSEVEKTTPLGQGPARTCEYPGPNKCGATIPPGTKSGSRRRTHLAQRPGT